MNLLKDKTIIITGAGSGLGRATALEAAREGAKLTLVDLNMDGLDKTKELIEKEAKDTKVILVKADVSKENEVKNYVDKTIETYGKVDGLYNNAGIEGKQMTTSEFETDEFNKVLAINTNGVFYGMKYVLQNMEQQQSGAIVNVASVAGIRGLPTQLAYVASKHAVSGMTKVAAAEYGGMGIHVNAIAPGAILTAMVENSFRKMAGDNWEETLDQFVQGNPTKRFGQPEEVAKLVVFLLSDNSKYVNGMVIPIDGGQSSQY